MASHRVPHPSLKPRPARALALAGDREGGRWRSRPILGRRLLQQNTADTCAKMRRTADGERINVEWSLLEPRGVVGDEGESAETDLLTPDQNSSRHHDESTRKNRNFSTKIAKTPAPRWAPTVVVLSLTVEWGVGMERPGPSYGEVVSTKDVRVQALLGRSNSPTSRSPEAVEWIMSI